MAEQKNRGFQSAAGLIQYYDMEETKSIKIPPEVVVLMGLGAAVIVEFLRWKYA